MSKENKFFTLENYKLASMGVDFIVVIPRKIIKYKVLDPNKRYNIRFEEAKEINQEKKN